MEDASHHEQNEVEINGVSNIGHRVGLEGVDMLKRIGREGSIRGYRRASGLTSYLPMLMG